VAFCPATKRQDRTDESYYGSAYLSWRFMGGEGSYGLNLWLLPDDPIYAPAFPAGNIFKKYSDAQGSVPLLGDSVWIGSWPFEADAVPDDITGQTVMRTVGKPAAIRLTADRKELTATGEALCYILVEALDADGTLCPLADNPVRFKVEGPAEIAGVGNGNPLSLEPFQSDSRKLFYGKAMLILRTRERPAGRVRVTAESDGPAPADVTVYCR